MLTIEQIRAKSLVIKNEVRRFFNTGARFDEIFQAILDHLQAGGGGGGLWGTITGTLSDQTDLNTELGKLDKVKNAEGIVTDAGFTITFYQYDTYIFPQPKGLYALVNKEDTTYNGYYKFIEEISGEWYYELITPTPRFVTVSMDMTFGQGVFYPELMTADGEPLRWKQITDSGRWGTITGTLSDQTDLNTELGKLDKVKNAEGIVTDAGFTITFYQYDTYIFPQPKGLYALVNKEDTTYNGYYKFIEEISGEWYYELITPTPRFVTVSMDMTFGQGVFYPELMSADGTPLRWKQITDENVIEEIQVNGTPLEVTEKAVNIGCAPPLGADDNYVSDELLGNISNIPTINPVDGDEYSFITEKGTYKTISIQTLTLELEDWDTNLQQTKTITGIADKIIEMTAVAESTSLNFTEAAASQLRILEDLSTGNDLVFQVENLPEIDLTVKIKIS